ncbi:hypothetical protein [Litorimonas sp.]|uniref:hypothetical protein n=1 Tax=Litorimonas sp. TaxID=1892381 RepID=UPI003A8AD2CA
MTYHNTVALTAIATLLTAAPAFAGDKAKDMSKKEVFMKIDTNSDSQLTFTEFATFSESHGVSTSVAAEEFSRLAGQDTTINMDGFADFDMAGLKKNKMKSAMKQTDNKMSAPDSMRVDSIQTYENQPEAVLNRTITTSTDTSANMNVEYKDFAALDANSDGNVSYDEYWKMRKSQGLSSATKAAQEFTKLSNGQRTLSQSQYQAAISNDVLNTPRYRSTAGMEASVTSDSSIETDRMNETETRQDYPVDNNPAGLNQMNDPDAMSNMTNSGAETDLDKTSNPQMKVWGEK